MNGALSDGLNWIFYRLEGKQLFESITLTVEKNAEMIYGCLVKSVKGEPFFELERQTPPSTPVKVPLSAHVNHPSSPIRDEPIPSPDGAPPVPDTNISSPSKKSPSSVRGKGGSGAKSPKPRELDIIPEGAVLKASLPIGKKKKWRVEKKVKKAFKKDPPAAPLATNALAADRIPSRADSGSPLPAQKKAVANPASPPRNQPYPGYVVTPGPGFKATPPPETLKSPLPDKKKHAGTPPNAKRSPPGVEMQDVVWDQEPKSDGKDSQVHPPFYFSNSPLRADPPRDHNAPHGNKKVAAGNQIAIDSPLKGIAKSRRTRKNERGPGKQSQGGTTVPQPTRKSVRQKATREQKIDQFVVVMKNGGDDSARDSPHEDPRASIASEQASGGGEEDVSLISKAITPLASLKGYAESAVGSLRKRLFPDPPTGGMEKKQNRA